MSMLLSAVGVSLVFGIFMLLVPIALLVVLQVWLCRKSLMLGLILPGLSLLLSLLLVFILGVMQAVTTGGSYLVAEDGTYMEVPAQEGEHFQEEHQVNLTPGAVGALVGLFLVGNIPTAVFGGIWLHYKNRRDFQEDLKKMRIEDLE